jgi:hypothetical protein
VGRWPSYLREFSGALKQTVVLLFRGGLSICRLRLDELALMLRRALNLTRRDRFSSGFRRPLLGQGEVIQIWSSACAGFTTIKLLPFLVCAALIG